MVTKEHAASDNPDVLIDLQIHTEDKQQASATTMNARGNCNRSWGFRTGVSINKIKSWPAIPLLQNSSSKKDPCCHHIDKKRPFYRFQLPQEQVLNQTTIHKQ